MEYDKLTELGDDDSAARTEVVVEGAEDVRKLRRRNVVDCLSDQNLVNYSTALRHAPIEGPLAYKLDRVNPLRKRTNEDE